VIALATGLVDDASLDGLRGLTFVGLAGMTDPPAAGVPETVRRLQGAGIRLVMITGDQRETADAIGRSLGIVGSGDMVIDGYELDRMSDAGLAAALPRLAAVSRATPEGKLRLVNAFAGAGEVVAMLGDGINDAAALKRAHIGVAMGRRGTDVAKEASGIILQDDRFETIAAAVEEGRVVFANIRRFVFYLFSCNVAELVALLAAGVTGLPLPMTALQILWVNIVTDGVAAMPLVFEPPEPGVLEAPPRHPAESILSGRLLLEGSAFALAIAAVTIAALCVGLRGAASPAHAVTLSFMTLALAQIFHLGNARSERTVLTLRAALRNKPALVALPIVLALQVASVTVAPLARVLGTVPLEPGDWVVVVALALVPAVAGQGVRLVRGART
jgi:P-type Ca2+ transporter type 2C